MRRSLTRAVLLLALAAAVPACGGGGGGGGSGGGAVPVRLVSASSPGTGSQAGDGDSDSPVMSADGRYVAFRSSASNLVPSDTVQGDIFLKDMETGDVTRISRRADGGEPNQASFSPAMTPDGKYVAYLSAATDIIVAAGITGGQLNVYLYDVDLQTTSFVNHSTSGLLNQANGGCANPSVSATTVVGLGTQVYVAFESSAQDLVTGYSGYAGPNIYRKTRGNPTIQLVSRDVTNPTTTTGNASSTAPSMSADGNLIAFQSSSTNLTALADTNGFTDVFVRNMTTGVTERVSLTAASGEITGGGSSAPVISADGAHVAFVSTGTNLGDPFSPPLGAGVANDIYLRANWATAGTRTTEHISLHPGFGSGEGCGLPAISPDGTVVAWGSPALNLVNGDGNGIVRDVFRKNRTSTVLDRVSLSNTGAELTGNSGLNRPGVGTGGAFIAFDSQATDVISPPTTGRHVYRRG